jgi:hypothetical protein
MGIDLKVLASHFRERRGEFLATASLRVDRDSALLSQLGVDANPGLVHPLPPGLKVGHYEEDGLKYDTVDRHGEPLTFTTPVELRKLRVPEDTSPWNRAVLAFLMALPPDARIVLYSVVSSS